MRQFKMYDSISTYQIDTLQNVKYFVNAESVFTMLPLHEDFFSLPSVIVSLFLLFVLYCIAVSTSLNYLGMERNTLFLEKERSSFSMVFPSQYIYSKLILAFLSILSIGYFAFQVVSLFTGKCLPYQIFFFSGVLLLFLLFNYFFMFLVGIVFFRQKQSVQYIKKHFLLFAFAGIVLFPLAIFSIYTSTAISLIVFWISILVVVILEIALIYKLLQIFFERNIALFYLLLYLCIWKFLPIFAFVKVLGEMNLIVEF